MAVIKKYGLLGHYVEVACNDLQCQRFHRSHQNQDSAPAPGRFELSVDRSE